MINYCNVDLGDGKTSSVVVDVKDALAQTPRSGAQIETRPVQEEVDINALPYMLDIDVEHICDRCSKPLNKHMIDRGFTHCEQCLSGGRI